MIKISKISYQEVVHRDCTTFDSFLSSNTKLAKYKMYKKQHKTLRSRNVCSEISSLIIHIAMITIISTE